MGKYFGTDGFRGEANVVLTVEHAFKVGRFLGFQFHVGVVEVAEVYVEHVFKVGTSLMKCREATLPIRLR